MKMDRCFVAHEDVRLVAPPARRRRDWRAPVLVVAALLAAGTAVANRPAPPARTPAQPLS